MPPTRHLLSRGLAAIAALIVAAGLLALTPAAASATAPAMHAATTPSTAIRPAADLSQFRAGNIISDAVFTDSSTMNAEQAQAFLASKVSSCRSGYVCLKDFRQNTPNKAADEYCNGYTGAGNESAGSIIARVAQSCGINPQVLIVMLQKEQGLVTDTWPIDRQYSAALGQACPDTAPCDPSYAGFFAQVYGGARQMKIYLEGIYFTWYAPGRTWNIQYNPNQGCGSSPVHIENAATSALYYYTPYQPNTAALSAGYGTGNGCSAYGNRNFFNYFTDWFGSPQAQTTRLVKTDAGDEIYLVVNGWKRHIVSATDLAAYTSRLGWYQTIPASSVNAIPTGREANRFIRDPRDGGMYLIESDGSKHHFLTAGDVTRFGFDMGLYTEIPGEAIDRFSTAADVGPYFRSDDGDAYYRWEAGVKRHIINPLAWARIPASQRGYVATLPAGNAAGIRAGLPILPAGTLVKEQNAPEVYLAGAADEMQHIPTWGAGYDVGAVSVSVFPPGTLASYRRLPGSLAPFIVCGDRAYAADGGGLTGVAGVPAGAPATTLPASLCDWLPRTGTNIGDATFAKTPSADPIYVIAGNQLRHARSQQRLSEVSAGRPWYFLSWSADTRSAFATGSPLLADGSFVSFGTEEIFYVVGGKIRHVTSEATLFRLANSTWPWVERLTPEARGTYVLGDPIS